MRRLLPFLLLLLILVPLALLGIFGMQLVNTKQKQLSQELQQLTTDKLIAVNQDIQSYFSRLAKELRAETKLFDALLQENVSTPRDYVRNSTHVRQVFLISPKGDTIFPSTRMITSVAEREFLQRTRKLWDEQTIYHLALKTDTDQVLTATPQDPGNFGRDNTGRSSREFYFNAQQSSTSNIQQSRKILSKEQPQQIAINERWGWLVWFANDEMNHILWWRRSDGYIAGMELNPYRVLADVIALLPATNRDDKSLLDARIRMVDNRNNVLYQWGHYEAKPEETPRASLALEHPLGAWRLNYLSGVNQTTPQVAMFNTYLVYGLIALLMCVIGFIIYREYNRAAQQARTQVSFVNQVSHELRTPLTNIRMYSEMLEGQIDDDQPRAQKYLGIITSESERLSRLVSNVLSFARSQRKTLQLNPSKLNVAEVIQRCHDAFSPLLASKGVQLRYTANSTYPDVHVDRDALEQILNNLLSNAEKYAASGEWVDIEHEQHDALVTIRVRDYGPGIPSNEHKRIFSEFYRLDNSIAEGASGTGIGLNIARQLAQAHGGNLIIENCPNGESGACFRLTLATSV